MWILVIIGFAIPIVYIGHLMSKLDKFLEKEGIMIALGYFSIIAIGTLLLYLPRQIREKSSAPIIVVSAREEESEKIRALDLGADDYMTKPFHMGELLARMRVSKRKLNSIVNPYNVETFTSDYLSVDYEKGLVFVDSEEVHLTPVEYKLLKLLIANKGKVLTHNYILNQVWGYGESNDAKSLRVFMASLRRKIERDTAKPRFILTQVGIGYRFVGE